MASRTSSNGLASLYQYNTAAPSRSIQQKVLTVMLPPHAFSGRITAASGGFWSNGRYMPTLKDELLRYGNLAVVEYPAYGSFSYEQIAATIYRQLRLESIDRLIILGMSMGGRVGTALLDVLRQNFRDNLATNGLFIAECAPWDAKDVKLPLALAQLWRWPQFFNGPGYWLLNRLSPGYTIEPGAEPHTAAHMRFLTHISGSARRGQMTAMRYATPVQAGRYAGVPLHCLTSGNDPLVRESAFSKYRSAFGGTAGHTYLGQAWHCSHPERPSLYNYAVLGALRAYGFYPA